MALRAVGSDSGLDVVAVAGAVVVVIGTLVEGEGALVAADWSLLSSLRAANASDPANSASRATAPPITAVRILRGLSVAAADTASVDADSCVFSGAMVPCWVASSGSVTSIRADDGAASPESGGGSVSVA